MKCEILSIGSEITSGQNLDTNSQWLSRLRAAICRCGPPSSRLTQLYAIQLVHLILPAV